MTNWHIKIDVFTWEVVVKISKRKRERERVHYDRVAMYTAISNNIEQTHGRWEFIFPAGL